MTPPLFDHQRETLEAITYAWGHVHCRRCDRGSVIVSEEVDNVARLSGIQCPKCLAPSSCRFTFRRGLYATQDAAVAKAEAWTREAMGEPPPKRGA